MELEEIEEAKKTGSIHCDGGFSSNDDDDNDDEDEDAADAADADDGNDDAADFIDDIWLVTMKRPYP